MIIYSIANQKGGVGKTTTCLNLSYALSKLGKKVLAVDFDPQANLTSGFGINSSQSGIYDVFSEKKNLDEIIKKINENLYLIPSSFELSGFVEEIKDEKYRENLLKNLLKNLKNFDYILIDTPPSLSLLTVNALTASNGVIIPVQSEYYSLEGLTHLLKVIKKIKDFLNPSLKIRGFLITLFDKRLKLSYAIEEELRKAFKEKVFKTIIPRSVRIAEAPSFGKSIFDYAPDSPGAIAYFELGKEILERDEKEGSW
jgi:chromosome partitioning protein